MVQTRTSPGPIAKPDGADQAETLLNHVFRSRPLDLRAGTCRAPLSEVPRITPATSAAFHRRRGAAPLRAARLPGQEPESEKVLGPGSDMAEEQALLYLQRLRDEPTTLSPGQACGSPSAPTS
jgi:hypothetical protein